MLTLKKIKIKYRQDQAGVVRQQCSQLFQHAAHIQNKTCEMNLNAPGPSNKLVINMNSLLNRLNTTAFPIE